MNYIQLINNFWNLNETCNFNATETQLYFYLLNEFNKKYWDKINISNNRICDVKR